MSPSAIVQKLWTRCNVVRDDGMSYADYLSAESILSPSAALRINSAEGLRTGSELLTWLLFLKMADERTCKQLGKGMKPENDR